MTWHIELIVGHARRYLPGESYEARDKFASIVTVQFMNGRKAYLSGMLNDRSCGPIRPADWLELRDKLRDEFGVEVVSSERHGERRDYDTRPAPLL